MLSSSELDAFCAQVVALAVNSGFVTYPKAYSKAHASHGLTVWHATPPDGFVALGCLVTSAEDGSAEAEPPALTDMVCVHASIGTNAHLGQCLDLHLTADGQERKPAGGMLVWCIDNAMATFNVCSTADGTPSGDLFLCRASQLPCHGPRLHSVAVLSIHGCSEHLWPADAHDILMMQALTMMYVSDLD